MPNKHPQKTESHNHLPFLFKPKPRRCDVDWGVTQTKSNSNNIAQTFVEKLQCTNKWSMFSSFLQQSTHKLGESCWKVLICNAPWELSFPNIKSQPKTLLWLAHSPSHFRNFSRNITIERAWNAELHWNSTIQNASLNHRWIASTA